MGTLKDLKRVMYGNFIKWLETEAIDVPLGDGNFTQIKVGDCFSNDVWAQFILRSLMQIYSERLNRKKELSEFMASLPAEELERILKKRREVESKSQAKKSKIFLPPGVGKVSTPTGVKIDQHSKR